MQNFTQAIRYGNSNREFIIGNVLGVLDNTFTYFSSYACIEISASSREYMRMQKFIKDIKFKDIKIYSNKPNFDIYIFTI